MNIDLDNYRKIVLIFPVWGYTPALPMQSFLRKHSLNNEVEIISVGVGRLGGMYEDVHKLLPHAKITRFTHVPRASDLTDRELETMLRNRSLPSFNACHTHKRLGCLQREIKRALISQMQNCKDASENGHMCKTPQVKPKPRLSTNPAPDCLSFQNNILYFNGQPIGMGVFYDALPSEGSEVTISGSTNAV